MNMPVNWKVVVAGLGVVAVGLYLLAPNLIAAALPFLVLAACPLAMLLMMKGMHESPGEASGQQESQEGTDASLTREEQIAKLRRQQAVLADRIDALERDDPRLDNSRRRTADTEGRGR